MSPNYLSKIFLLTGLVILILLALYFIPESWVESCHLRKIDILSDIRTVVPETEDSIPEPLEPDTCCAGLVCFDDYSPNRNGMSAFYKALGAVDTLKRPVRIAFFSDSFTEGDIFSGDLRAELQTHYGGSGVGMMPLTSATYGFRRTVIHQFGGWDSYSLVNRKGNSLLGISGEAFVPGSNAWVYYGGVTKNTGLDTCRRVSIFYSLPEGEAKVSYKINKTLQNDTLLSSSGEVQRLDINETCGNISLTFSPKGRLIVYGVSLEDTTGVLVDNFAMRGSSGFVLKAIPQHTLESFNRTVHYDLIILQYGLNIVEVNKTNFSTYQKKMIETVRYLQACFPESAFLMIGIPDKSMRKSGSYQTMPAVPAINAVQKQICAETGIVFWNLFEAMGGKNSMVDFVNSKPPKANKDYTHLTFEGGAYLGRLLFETIAYEKERYERKVSYQNRLAK